MALVLHKVSTLYLEVDAAKQLSRVSSASRWCIPPEDIPHGPTARPFPGEICRKRENILDLSWTT